MTPVLVSPCVRADNGEPGVLLQVAGPPSWFLVLSPDAAEQVADMLTETAVEVRRGTVPS